MSQIVCLSGCMAALATGCQVAVAPPAVEVTPPVAEVTVGVPDTYVWDGVEYVGMVGGNYYYLGAGGAWVVADPVIIGRFHGWERGHPDWRAHAVRNRGADARGRAARREERRDEHR